MSTEHQQYSIENQGETIRQDAERRGIAIVRMYADSGKSGLRIDGREALQRLIRDVQSGQADFSVILGGGAQRRTGPGAASPAGRRGLLGHRESPRSRLDGDDCARFAGRARRHGRVAAAG